MRLFLATTACLFCTSCLAQSSRAGGPPPPPSAAPSGAQSAPALPSGTPVRERSRVRAFNAGPDGRVRSLYLSNGSVVDLRSAPGPNGDQDFGPGLSSLVHKGTRVQLAGSRIVRNGQTIVVPQELTIGQQSFHAQPVAAMEARAGIPQPPTGGAGGPDAFGPPGAPGAPGTPGTPGAPPPPAGRPGMPPPPPPPPAGPGALPPPPPPPAGAPGQPPPPPAATGQQQPPAAPGAPAGSGTQPQPDGRRNGAITPPAGTPPPAVTTPPQTPKHSGNTPNL